jgi:hypothetical protein
VDLVADRVADLAGRPLSALTRRDVALALLSVPSPDALASLPGIRRGMLAAGNPLSAAFWSSTEAVLEKIEAGRATVGDVRTWLETTGTEPNGIIGLHVWDEQNERSQLAAEMHTRLVGHLEDRLAAGEIDPDLLATADPAACQAYIDLQERWMTSALPDGRIPMDVLLDEEDEEFAAQWDAADADALDVLATLLAQVGDRPLPRAELRRACARLRRDLARPGWPGGLLAECTGLRGPDLPAGDTELWLTLAAGAASPQGSGDWGGPADPDKTDLDEDGLDGAGLDGDSLDGAGLDGAGLDGAGLDGAGLDETGRALAAIAAIDHFDWLVTMTALATGGPGTPASADDLAKYIRDYDPEDDEHGGAAADEDDDLGFYPDPAQDADFDEGALAAMFGPLTSLWQVLGAIDDGGRLTPLGWWGLPEAMRRVWDHSGGERS